MAEDGKPWWVRSTKRYYITCLVIVVLAGLVIWLGASAVVTWKFTRRSGPPFPEPPPQVAWAKREAHRLKTDDGQEIGAWLARGDPQKGCVVLLHGIRGVVPPDAADHAIPGRGTLHRPGDQPAGPRRLDGQALTTSAGVPGTMSRRRWRFSGSYSRRRPIYIVGPSMGVATSDPSPLAI